jgi:hypothetical protein
VAIPVGTTTGGGLYRPKKKKKKPPVYLPNGAPAPKQPAQPQYSPPSPKQPKLGFPTTEDVANKVVKGYYNKTGMLPAPETTIALTQAALSDPSLVTQEDFNDLFRPWLKFIEDPKDIDPRDIVNGKTGRTYERVVNKKDGLRAARGGYRWSPEDEARAVALFGSFRVAVTPANRPSSCLVRGTRARTSTASFITEMPDTTRRALARTRLRRRSPESSVGLTGCRSWGSKSARRSSRRVTSSTLTGHRIPAPSGSTPAT